jgi:MSHA biogenesis protein MshQ
VSRTRNTANVPGAPGVGSDPTIGTFTNGVGTLTFSAGAGLTFTRTTPNLPFNADIALAVNVIDGDGVFYAGNPAAFGAATAGNGIAFFPVTAKQMRFGRLTLGNAFGSELLDLAIPIETQYYNSSGVYVTNVDDSCTSIVVNNVVLSSGAATAGGVFVAGKGNLNITKPLSKVSINLCVDLDGVTQTDNSCVASVPANQNYLQWKWSGAAFNKDPKALATFGVFKNADEFIYLRENF